MMAACHCGYLSVAELLLDRGAAVDRTRPDGAAALYISCQKGHIDTARVCLDHGADVNRACVGRLALTPLFIACSDVDVAKLLLDRGADVDPSDPTPLYIEIRRGTTVHSTRRQRRPCRPCE